MSSGEEDEFNNDQMLRKPNEAFLNDDSSNMEPYQEVEEVTADDVGMEYI